MRPSMATAGSRLLRLLGSTAAVTLDWADTVSTNLAGYNVYRSSSAGGTYTKLNSTPLTASDYADTNAPVGVVSYYRVVAIDKFGTVDIEGDRGRVETRTTVDGEQDTVVWSLTRVDGDWRICTA